MEEENRGLQQQVSLHVDIDINWLFTYEYFGHATKTVESASAATYAVFRCQLVHKIP